MWRDNINYNNLHEIRKNEICDACSSKLLNKNEFISIRKYKINYQQSKDIFIEFEKYDENNKRKIKIRTNKILTSINCDNCNYCIKCFKKGFIIETKEVLNTCYNNYIATLDNDEIKDILSSENKKINN